MKIFFKLEWGAWLIFIDFPPKTMDVGFPLREGRGEGLILGILRYNSELFSRKRVRGSEV